MDVYVLKRFQIVTPASETLVNTICNTIGIVTYLYISHVKYKFEIQISQPICFLNMFNDFFLEYIHFI